MNERKSGMRTDRCAFCGGPIGDDPVLSFRMTKLRYKPCVTWHLDCAGKDDLETRMYKAWHDGNTFDASMAVMLIEKRSPDRVRYFGKKKETSGE